MTTAHGWTLYGHPLLFGQVDELVAAVTRARRTNPDGWRSNANARILDALRTLMLDRVPSDPLSPIFRQGNTLGPEHRHWFRAKFGGNRFRLFFRVDSTAKIIVYAWVNDRDTLRKAGAANDPYAVFAGMLRRGNPPGDWPTLLEAARALPAVDRTASNDP